jgi:hypothetical protein
VSDNNDVFYVYKDNIMAVQDVSQYNMAFSENFGPLYFYVPKGTRKIRLDCWSIMLKAPSWNKARIFTNATPDANHEKPWNEELACLEIDAGTDDGKVWEIGRLSRGEYRFYNIPPYAAEDPGNLLVPREVLGQKK